MNLIQNLIIRIVYDVIRKKKIKNRPFYFYVIIFHSVYVVIGAIKYKKRLRCKLTNMDK